MSKSLPLKSQFLDQRLLYGSWLHQFVRELLTNSSVFWIFDMIRQTTTRGLGVYVSALPHWVLLGSGIIQAWFICRNPRQRSWWHHFIAPAIYTLIDVFIEGFANFFSDPYHILYWMWAAGMAAAYLLQKRVNWFSVLLQSLLLVSLLPASYMLSEWTVASANPLSYWVENSAHCFILLGTIILGILLGVTSIMQNHFERLLYGLAEYFEQIASWSFDSQLIQQAYADHHALALQSIERTVLFMDIRGFTPWSESHTPQQVVEVVNQFYRAAETIIKKHNGFKIQMTGDEIMTRFYSADEAIQAVQSLQLVLTDKLMEYGLSVGIGIHQGEVIEGLVGGEQTRQYGVFGDTVNIAARLQSQAQAGEVILSKTTWNKLTHPPKHRSIEQRRLTLKGKAEPISVIVLPLAKPFGA